MTSKMGMTDLEEAKYLFKTSGLAFPKIPEKLATQLKKRDRWLFSTREIQMSPYNLDFYVNEPSGPQEEDYVVLAHSGHGLNSYAIQYYVVLGFLRMFLHLGWGGVYSNAEADSARIRSCFSLADEIVKDVESSDASHIPEPMSIVCSTFYGSHWSALGEMHRGKDWDRIDPAKVLEEALDWLRNHR